MPPLLAAAAAGDCAINLYATVDIAKGAVISATYTQTLWNTVNRREHLWTSKCFWYLLTLSFGSSSASYE